jgi:hypothetical protein
MLAARSCLQSGSGLKQKHPGAEIGAGVSDGTFFSRNLPGNGNEIT